MNPQISKSVALLLILLHIRSYIIDYLGLTLAEMSYEFGSVRRFVRPFVTRDLRIGWSVFSDVFCTKLDSRKVRKVAKPIFFYKKIVPSGQGGPNVLKMPPIMSFLVFHKILSIYIYFFTLKVVPNSKLASSQEWFEL